MKLWAISDLHVRHGDNRRAVERIDAHEDDWLILGGDVGETVADLVWVLDTLAPRFEQLLWVPGNHELWTMPGRETARGVAKYQELVTACRARGVLTPEDPYPVVDSEDGPRLLAPLFILYDYSFCPQGMSPAEAIAWAREEGLECVDEHLLHPDPYASRQAWCEARVSHTEERLERARRAHPDVPMILINHFPLVSELAILPRVPRFRIWCGTQKTADWPERFAATTVVYGHLHIRRGQDLAGVRHEEVSLGYPKQWRGRRGTGTFLTPILPMRPLDGPYDGPIPERFRKLGLTKR